MQEPERDVRLAGCRLRRRRETNGDADEPEGQRSVPGGAHELLRRFGEPPHSAPEIPSCTPGSSRLPDVSTDRTIARLWRDAVARQRSGTAYLVQHGDHWHEVTWAEAAERVENLANGLLSRGVRKGEAFATLARTTLEWALFDYALAQVGAVGAPVYANSSPADVAYVLEHSESVGVLCEDAEQVAKVESQRASLPGLRHVLTYRRPRRAGGRGGRLQGRAPLRPRRCGRGDRRGRPVHVHLHVGDDRAAQGLHDPPPQLLRDGVGDRSPAALRPRRRPDAPLPPARAQLRPADAPDRPVCRATRSHSSPTRCRPAPR